MPTKKTNNDEFRPRDMETRRIRLLTTDKAYYDALIKAQFVPVTGGINTNATLVRVEKPVALSGSGLV